MSVFHPSVETKREFLTALTALTVLLITPSLIANTTHHFVQPSWRPPAANNTPDKQPSACI